MRTKHPNYAYGANLEPFGGITTFMRQPASRKLDDVDVAVVGVPYDSGTSYRSGARFGPRKIREASLLLWGYNQVLEIAPAEELRIIDYGDVDVVPVDIQATMVAIEQEIKTILEAGLSVATLGGDHSISLPLLRAHSPVHGPLAVLHFDSHPDTWDNEYNNQPYSHGTPFRRAIEEGLINTDAYIQVGVRGSTSRRSDLDDALQLGAKVITIEQAFQMGIDAVIVEIQKILGDRSVYISLDIDAVDPAFAPGTGTPEVGGFTSYQMLHLLRGLKGLNLIGFDLVEVCPPYDHGEITSILAANLVFELLSLLGLKK